jgi:hypothetical protein
MVEGKRPHPYEREREREREAKFILSSGILSSNNGITHDLITS